MTTECLIGIIRKNGLIESISCHYDGYIKHGTGEMLFNNYQNEMKVKELINLGNICVLRKHIKPLNDRNHSLIHPVKDVTIVYSRDVGEENQEAKVFKNLDDFSRYYNYSWFTYAYLYDERQMKWFYVHDNVTQSNMFQPLENAISQIEFNEIQGIEML